MKFKVGNNYYDTRSTEIACDPKFGHSHDGVVGGVKSISINAGDPYAPDTNGNIDLPMGAITGTGLASALNATVSVGGVQNGDKFEVGTSIEEILRKMLVKEVAPSFSITLTPESGIYHKGDKVKLTAIKYTVSQGSASALSSVSITDNTTKLVDTVNVKSETKTVSKEYSTDTTFTGTLMYLDKSGTARNITAKATYVFADYLYMGAISGEVTSEKISALTKKLDVKAAGSFAYTTQPGEVMVYAYPASLGSLTSIKDSNGYNLGSFLTNKKTIKIGNIDYIVYFSNEVEVSNYEVTFA